MKRFKRSTSTQFAAPSVITQQWGQSCEGSKDELSNERKSKSSLDVCSAAVEESPRASRRKRLWNSFRRLRTRSHDKGKKSREKKGYDQDTTVENDIGVLHDSDSTEVEESVCVVSNRSDLNSNFKIKTTSSRRSFQHSVERSVGRSDSERDLDNVSANNNSFSHKANFRHIQESVSSLFNVKVSDEDGLRISRASASSLRNQALREHTFFVMDIFLESGRNLIPMDSNGTSDPYVKFKVGNKQLYKSRTIYKTLNPDWNERFTIPVEDPFKKIRVLMFDYDRGVSDDPMGVTEIDPTSLDLNVPTDLELNLTGNKPRNYGYISLQCTLIPKTQEDKEDLLESPGKSKYFKKTMKDQAARKSNKMQVWSSVVTIVLVDGRDLLAMDDNGFSDPYVKFKLGNEKYKSKCKLKTLTPSWLEQFDLYMYDDHSKMLEISVWDYDSGAKDDMMGRTNIDLSQLDMEVTHTLDQKLEDGAGYITLLLTISGTVGTETVSDLSTFTHNPIEKRRIISKFGLVNTPRGMSEVGWLQVKVMKADGVQAADLGGRSDPFCVLELVNSRLQTHTEYKTLSPEWGKIFNFTVKDIHSVLEVTVWDEDKDKKVEFLGKVAIPLLKIKPGERKWYTLKDKKLLKRSKGAILLEMDLVFNNIRAAVRTVNPAEVKYMKPEPKFKISAMKRNIDRVSQLAEAAVESGKFIKSCFNWDSKVRSIVAFMVYLIMVWNFELYMVPLGLLIVFIKNLMVVQIVGNLMKEKNEDDYYDDEDDDEDDDKDSKNKKQAKVKEEKKSFKEKLQAIQEVCLQVQEGMDMVASMGERVKNTFNWTVPWLSWLAVIALTVGTVVLYFVPLRILLMLWGINKFTKRLRKGPNFVDNNELLDFLSRVPSDKELVMYRELRPEPGIGMAKKKRS